MNKKIIWGIVAVLIVAGMTVAYVRQGTPEFGRERKIGQYEQYAKGVSLEGDYSVKEDVSALMVKKLEWGILFPLPVGWNVTNEVDSQIVLTEYSSGDRITLDYTESQSYTDIDAKRGQVTYTFNDVSGKWVAVENTYTDGGMVSNEAKPILMIKNVIPVFAGSSRWKTYIVPLSHTQFLKVNITGSGQTAPLDEFIKTIIISG